MRIRDRLICTHELVRGRNEQDERDAGRKDRLPAVDPQAENELDEKQSEGKDDEDD